MCFWIPVHHFQVAVQVALVVQINEYFYYGFRKLRLHGKSCALPIAAGTQAAQLFQYDSSVFFLPFPSMAQEFFSAHILFGESLLAQLLHHLGFGGNGGMVGARHPAGIVALHSRPTDKDVLYGVVEHVAHVQHPGYIRWWNEDGVWLPFVWHRTKKLMLHPLFIPFVFYLLRLELLGNFHVSMRCLIFYFKEWQM